MGDNQDWRTCLDCGHLVTIRGISLGFCMEKRTYVGQQHAACDEFEQYDPSRTIDENNERREDHEQD